MNRQDELFQAALEELRKAEQMNLFGGGTGEGSRGGHVVGHTSGGDAIYESQQTAKKHRAKAGSHYEEAAKLPQGKAKIAHLGAGSRHEDAARKHDEAARFLTEGIPAGYAAGKASEHAETASRKAEEASKPREPRVKALKPSKEEKRAEEQKRHGGPESVDEGTKQRQLARETAHNLAKEKHTNRASQHRRMARYHRDQMTGKGGDEWKLHKEAQDKHFEAAEKHDAALEAIGQHGHDSETATKKMADAEGLSGEANARSEAANKPTGYVGNKAPRKSFTENEMNKAKAFFGDYDLSKAVQQQNGFYEPFPFGLKTEMEPTEVTTPAMTQHQVFGASTIEMTPEIVDGYAVLNQPFQSVDDKRVGLSSIFGDETVQIDEDGKIPGAQPPYGSSY